MDDDQQTGLLKADGELGLGNLGPQEPAEALPTGFFPCAPGQASATWKRVCAEHQTAAQWRTKGEMLKQQRERMLEEERQRAVAAGEEIREKIAEESRVAFVQAAEQLVAQLQEGFAQEVRQMEEQMIALAADITAQIIRRKVATDDSIVVDVVREAVAKVAGAGRVEIVVNPADEEVVAAAQQELLAALEGLTSVRITGSNQVDRGGVIIRSDRGEVDARIATQLEILTEHISSTSALEPVRAGIVEEEQR